MFSCQCQIFTITLKNGAYTTQDFLDCVWEGYLQIDNTYFELINPFSREKFGKSMSILTPVKDSSRYFVVKIEQQGKQFFCGIGLLDRSDALELQERVSNVKYSDSKAEKVELSDLPQTEYAIKSTIVVKNTPKAETKSEQKGWIQF